MARLKGNFTERLRSLPPEKRRLLEMRLAEMDLGVSEREIIRPAPRDGELPLSFSQERLWFLDRLEPGNPFYNVPIAVRLVGELDGALLERALAALIERHETLRTSFDEVEGRPVQRIAGSVAFALRREDLSRLAAEEREGVLARHLAEEAQRPFDLSAAPLLRATLFRLTEGEHALLIVQHHIVTDGWSQTILIGEMVALCGTLAQGLPSPLAELPVQYVDYAAWQRSYLSGDVLEGQIAFWRERLASPPSTELLGDRPRPPIQSFRGTTLTGQLGEGPSQALAAAGKERGASSFMVLLAAFDALLARETGESDLVVGTPVANRRKRALENLVGVFINTLVMRTDASGDPTFEELLARVKEDSLAAFAHQELPFERLVDELQPERDLSRNPLFQILFNTGVAPPPAAGKGGAAEGGIEVEPLVPEQATSLLDLSLIVTPSPSGMQLVWEYSTDLFDRTTIERLAGRLERLITAVAAEPTLRLSQIPLLAAPERQQLLVEWNDTGRPREELPIQRLLAERAAADPAAAAVVCGGEEVSYGELLARVRAVAAGLRAEGLGHEEVVAVSLRRSPRLVSVLLGILEAGGAYLPLDPDYPAERLAFMLADSGARLLVAEAGLGDELATADVRRLEASELEAAEAAETSSPGPEAAPEQLAYVLYTSGSTGRPKGVQIPHGALGNFLRSMGEEPGLEAGDVLLAVTSLSFDIAGLELYLPLILGARVHLAREEESRDGEALAALTAASGATAMQATPSTWRLLLDAGWRPRDLKVMCGGEALPEALAEALTAEGGVVWNLYGPTETTVWSAVARVEAGRQIRIGRPIANTSIHLLDRQGGAVPAAVPGELLIGGAGLARGYLGRPALTAERFVPDPFSEAPGGRLYRTGDLARRRAGGELEFLGRLDHQVKLRGFRIELGEIESALAAHEAVAEAVALVREDRPGDPRLVAYVVAAQGSEQPAAEALREHLAERLPPYMLPSAYVPLSALPLTPNLKVDRKALPPPAAERAERARIAPASEVESRMAEIWCEVLGVEEVGVEESFFDLGGHSLLLGPLRNKLREAFELEVPVAEFFRFPTVRSLARRFLSEREQPRRAEEGRRRAERRRGAAESAEIAVVGLAARFPGAPDAETFWRNLAAGVESVRRFSEEELLAAGVAPEAIADPNYVPACALLDDADLFDADFFAMSPREAEVTDPQQRVFLEQAFQALVDAGCDPDTYAGAIGVFGGVSLNQYWQNIFTNPQAMAAVGYFQTTISNDKDFLPTRVSYKLNLRGPSYNIQTACSTSLVALHVACQALIHGECDMALAGGVSVQTYDTVGYVYEPEAILSPDGRCRAFDAGAQGTVTGNGAGVVALKRLDDALADGDAIRAVIRGTATNNDGSLKAGFTAPSVEGQAEAIAEAQSVAGVGPEEVTYVEAHGTATPLGDPIEVAALIQAFGRGGEGDGAAGAAGGKHCALGSVKTNIGHLDAAAGVAGAIKTVLALEHGQIPPSLHYERPNPEIDFGASPFFVATELRDWRPVEEGGRRIAGVSSFGLGGTNAHAVLEEAPPRPESGPSRPWQLLPVSASSEASLEAGIDLLADWLESNPEETLADVAHTLQAGRRRLAERRFVVTRDGGEAAGVLRRRDPERLLGGSGAAGRPAAFLCSGVGDQYPGMAAELYRGESLFRRELDRAAEIVDPILGESLLDLLYPEEEEDGGSEASGVDLKAMLGRGPAQVSEASRRLAETRVAQPAVFAVSWATAKLWLSWGVRPEALLGYSLGEYVAACLAGVFSLEDALGLVARRAALIETLPEGAMLAVPLPPEELGWHLGETLALAAENAPEVSVLAGPVEAVEALEQRLAEAEVPSQRLAARHAFHSPMMEPIAGPFRELVAAVDLADPEVPYLSNVTGDWIRGGEATDPDYWVRHLLGTVRFAPAVEKLLAGGERILIEVGPGQALATAVRQHPVAEPAQVVLSSLRDARDRQPDQAYLLGALGRYWASGGTVDWAAFAAGEMRRKVRLPGYVFDRQRYWLAPAAVPAAAEVPAAGRRDDLRDWFYTPSWKPRELPARAFEPQGPCLLFLDPEGVGEALGRRLRELGAEVAGVVPGAAFERRGEGFYSLEPGRREDYDALLAALAEEALVPATIVHLWAAGSSEGELEEEVDRAFYSPLFLSQALVEAGVEGPVDWLLATRGAFSVSGREPMLPERALALGPARVLPQEQERLRLRHVDFGFEAAEGPDLLASRLLEELAAEEREHAVAYRREQRWAESFEALALEAKPRAVPRLVEGGCYLITGGVGGIGLELAAELARRFRPRLVLTGRSPIPPREDWETWIGGHGEGDRTRRRLESLLALEAAGAEVLAVAADVASRLDMEALIDRVQERFGRIDGVFHAAGVAGQGLAQLKDREAVEPVLAPKVRGARLLDELLAADPPDLFVLFSSVGAQLGGFGQIDYAAANAYLDAFAHARSASGRGVTFSVAFGVWGEVGLALDVEIPEQYRAEHEAMLRQGIATAEGIEALLRVLDRSLPQVAVTPLDLRAQIAGSLALTTAGAHGSQQAAGSSHPRPELATAWVAPEAGAEEGMAAIWQELLGIEGIGAHDNFFELGGDSLMATQLISRTRASFHVQLSLQDVFEAPTVAALSARLAGQEGDEEMQRMDALLREIEEMEEAEAEDSLGEAETAGRTPA